jgi:D-glycero-alpha-D-manno-heptose-7-phosphate kinase
MIISRTPFRISFFGGGTDYPVWYQRHGGAVLSTTINKYCYITCRYLPPFFEHRFRLVYSKIENCMRVDEIVHPAVREVLRYLKIERGLEIHHDGDLPARSGMGSSSSFTVGLLHALYGLQGLMPSKAQLAEESIFIEQQCLKETVGSQDQMSAAHGGFNHIIFHPNKEISVQAMSLSHERVQELNSHLMLFYTGIKRTASNIAQSFVQDIERRRGQLLIMRDMVDESINILNSGQDIRGFGKLMHASWLAKRSLSTQISNDYLDDLYDAASQAGAIGGKLTGAGGGGFLLLFVPPSDQTKVCQKLEKLLYVPFKFEFSGSQIIFLDRQEDYADLEKARQFQKIQPFRELEESQSPGNSPTADRSGRGIPDPWPVKHGS